MRVLHVDPERRWGGGETQVQHLLRACRDRGLESTLAAAPGSPIAAAATALGVPVVPLAIRNHADVIAGLRLRRLARGFDVVHFHTARAHALAPFVGPRVRRVVTRRMDYIPKGGPYARWLYNRQTDVVIAISHGVRHALLAAGVDDGRIRIVASGVDTAAFRPEPATRAARRASWGVADDEAVILIVGALERRKGHAVLFDALARMAAERVRVICCGDGPEREALGAAARALRASVRFEGFRNDVPRYLMAADIVVMPSLQEGLGVAALEAMATGCAVVVSRVGGLGEVVVDGATGLVVPPGDAASLATALDRVIADPGLRARMGDAAQRRVAERYSVAQMAAGTFACYGSAACEP